MTAIHPLDFTFLCGDVPPVGDSRVAIIGAGPAGLSAAGALRCMGHTVELFDKHPEPGGLMRYGIPDFRMPEERIVTGCEALVQTPDITFHGCSRVHLTNASCELEGDIFDSCSIDFDALVSEFDAVLITTGSWRSRRLGIDGADKLGVFTSLEYLFPQRACAPDHEQLKLTDPAGKRIAVIGAGHSAVDVAMTTLRKGAKAVHMLYRRTLGEAPAGECELAKLMQLGVMWHELVIPLEVEGGERVESIRLQRAQLGEPGPGGRRRPEPVPDDIFELPVDIVVGAIGEIPTSPLPEELDLDHVKRGYTPHDQMVDDRGIFIAGDVLSGPSKIGPCIKSGLRVADAIDRYLRTGGTA